MSDALSQSCFSSLEPGIALIDPEGIVVYIDAVGERILDDGSGTRMGRKWDWSSTPDSTIRASVPVSSGEPRDVKIVHTGIEREVRCVVLARIYDLSTMDEIERQLERLEGLRAIAGGIAHDFNNYISSITGYTEFVRMNLPADSDNARDLDRVLDAANRAKTLVQYMHAFTRGVMPDRTPIALGYVTREYVELMEKGLPSSVQLDSQIAKGVAPVLADAAEMRDVVTRVCAYVLDSLGTDGGTLRVRFRDATVGTENNAGHPSLRAGRYAVLAVAALPHNAVGAASERPDAESDIPEVDNSMAPPGLKHVQHVVSNCGGAVCHDRRPPYALRVHVYLPVHVAVSPATGSRVLAEPAALKKHILVVDDEPSIVLLLEKLLTRSGYRVTAETSSLDALRAFEARPNEFDVLVTDDNMPEMKGDELFLAVRRVRPEFPGIVMSGLLDRGQSERLQALGFGAILAKPIDRNLLGAAIQQLFTSSG